MFWFVNKDSLMGVINRSLPAREAGLMAGILLGDKTGFEKSFYQNLINSGLIHLVVVSGSNVMLLIGGLIEQTAMYLGRKRAIGMGLMMGWWYVQLVGWEVPVLRAMLLLSIMYFAQLLGRKYNLWRGLLLAVLIMVVGDVRILTSVSFWLSIMAFLAIVTIKLNELLKTIWVSVWIFPIMAFVFGKVSIISPITNVLVIGIMEIITIIGAVGTGVGMVIPVLGKIVLWLTLPMLQYLAMVVEWGGKVTGWEIRFNWMMVTGYYCLLFYWLLKYKNKINLN